LVHRGDITFWFDKDVMNAWEHDNDEPKNGRPFTYSDMAVECLLTLRELFRLPYRQTEGLGRSLVKLMQANVAIPDFSSLAKRAAKLSVSLGVTARRGPIDMVVDSTGLKVCGEGEWRMRKHGKGKRRTWRKLHLTVNPHTQEVEAEVLTENSGHDADQVEDLLDHVNGPVDASYGDGAYDQWKVYDSLSQREIQPIVPPRRNAKIKQYSNADQTPLPRDEAIRGIRRVGRKHWSARPLHDRNPRRGSKASVCDGSSRERRPAKVRDGVILDTRLYFSTGKFGARFSINDATPSRKSSELRDCTISSMASS
jgi:hypothetical protein